MNTLFAEIVEAGIKYASHETDLYLPDTPQVREILKRYPLEDGNKTSFKNQVEGGQWFDVPFAYLPAWERKMR